MIDSVGIDGFDDGQIVDNFGGMRKQVADPHAGVAVLFELKMAGVTGNVVCPEVMPVMRCPLRMDSGSSAPRSR